MELKPQMALASAQTRNLLIVPYGIETVEAWC